ncbi:MAG: hypothetical protein NTV94_12280 [Planctomycetota bacterium]|nr:hypothetical protein [Planctomycetota bacterium]
MNHDEGNATDQDSRKDGAGTSRPVRVALVGHCGPDSWMLKGAASRAFPGAAIAMINDGRGVMEQAASADLLLINRVLDGDFEDESGVELISRLAAMKGRNASLMLISNFSDAQHQATAAGALPGFGKANAGSPAAAKLMQSAVTRR